MNQSNFYYYETVCGHTFCVEPPTHWAGFDCPPALWCPDFACAAVANPRRTVCANEIWVLAMVTANAAFFHSVIFFNMDERVSEDGVDSRGRRGVCSCACVVGHWHSLVCGGGVCCGCHGFTQCSRGNDCSEFRIYCFQFLLCDFGLAAHWREASIDWAFAPC